jgi:hypothetical protein
MAVGVVVVGRAPPTQSRTKSVRLTSSIATPKKMGAIIFFFGEVFGNNQKYLSLS